MKHFVTLSYGVFSFGLYLVVFGNSSYRLFALYFLLIVVATILYYTYSYKEEFTMHYDKENPINVMPLVNTLHIAANIVLLIFLVKMSIKGVAMLQGQG